MANIFASPNIESPEEAQRRILGETIAQRKSLGANQNTQLGFTLADALMRAFGKGGAEQIANARRQQQIIGEAQQTADREFVEQAGVLPGDVAAGVKINQEVYSQAMGQLQQQGMSPEQARDHLISLKGNEAHAARAQDYAKKQMEDVAARKQEAIDSGVNPDLAQEAALRIASTKMRSVNEAAANDLWGKANQIKKDRELFDLQKGKLQAEISKLEGADAIAATPLEKANAAIKRAEDRGVAEDSIEMIQLRNAADKAAGTEPSADLSKNYVTANKLSLETEETTKRLNKIYQNAEGGFDGQKLKATADVLAKSTDFLAQTESWTSAITRGLGIDGDVLTSALEESRNEIRKELLTIPGVSEADVVTLLQELESTVIREAKSFGGPITESDRAGARLASGLQTGRVDLVYAREVTRREQELNSVISQAVVEGTIRVNPEGEVVSQNGISREIRKAQARNEQARTNVDAMRVAADAAAQEATPVYKADPTVVPSTAPPAAKPAPSAETRSLDEQIADLT
jgi:hypothetical protein